MDDDEPAYRIRSRVFNDKRVAPPVVVTPDEPCFDGCSEAECNCPRCRAADAAWERLQGWDERELDAEDEPHSFEAREWNAALEQEDMSR